MDAVGKKRSSQIEDDEEQPTKRIATTCAVDLIDETFLATFKKDALWREIQVYKERLHRSEKAVESAELKSKNLELGLVELGASWSKLIASLCQRASNADSIVSLVSDLICKPELDESQRREIIQESLEKTISLVCNRTNEETPQNNSANELSNLQAENARLRMKLDILSNSENEARNRLQNTLELVEKYERKLHRQKSALVPMIISDTATQQTQQDQIPAQQDSTNKPNIDDATVLPSPSAEGKVELQLETKKLLAQIEEHKERNDLITEQLNTLQQRFQQVNQEKLELTKQLDQALVDFQLLPEHRIVETGTYRHMEAMLAHSREVLVITKKQNEEYRAQIEKMTTDDKLIVGQELESEKAKRLDLENEIKKLNGDMTRIRTTRDTLQQKYDSASADKKKLRERIAELKSQLGLYQNHAIFLSDCIERTKVKLAALGNDKNLYLNLLFALDLQLKSKKTEEISDESVIEYKSVVDSLQATIETLKAEGAQEHFAASATTSTINSSGDESLEQLLLEIESLKKTEAMALAEMEMIAQNYTALDARFREVNELLESKDGEFVKVQQEKTRLEHKILALTKEKDNANNKVIAMQKTVKKSEELIKQKEEAEGIRDELVKNLEQEAAVCRSMANLQENKYRDFATLTEELNARLGKNTAKYQEFTQMLRDKESRAHDLETAKWQSEDEIRKLQTKIRHLNKRIQSNIFTSTDETTGAASTADADELETLRGWKKIAQCNVCEFRIKNHVLSKCMHVFCKECIDSRLETRQRKCPQCGQAFGPGDVKPIYI